jgi:hypothetical protein
MKYWEIIADKLSKAGWSWGCVATVWQTAVYRRATAPEHLAGWTSYMFVDHSQAIEICLIAHRLYEYAAHKRGSEAKLQEQIRRAERPISRLRKSSASKSVSPSLSACLAHRFDVC